LPSSITITPFSMSGPFIVITRPHLTTSLPLPAKACGARSRMGKGSTRLVSHVVRALARVSWILMLGGTPRLSKEKGVRW
jgi:hypothetical protein